jgi:hypothetical protein
MLFRGSGNIDLRSFLSIIAALDPFVSRSRALPIRSSKLPSNHKASTIRMRLDTNAFSKVQARL